MSGGQGLVLELPPTFRRRDKLRLSLHRSISEPVPDPKGHNLMRSIEPDELARKLHTFNNNSNGGKQRLPFLLLDCRGFLCYSDSHIRGAVHIACTDRFNRKRVQNSSSSVLDLVSTNNRRNKINGQGGKFRDVIVYDEGTSDLDLGDSWSSPISFVIHHLIQENHKPLLLNGGIKEFSRYYRDLCDSCGNKDLNLSPMSTAESSMNTSPTTLSFLPQNSSIFPPLSPSPSPNCIDSYEKEPPTQVLPYLYVGNARDAGDKDLLRSLGIRYILSVTNHYSANNNNNIIGGPTMGGKCHHNSENFPAINNEDGEFRTKLIPVNDNLCENLAPFFDDACDFIEEARTSDSSILIHCQAGISRSPTFAIAYIMKQLNMTCLEAYALVQRNRRIISPNLNFMGQLVEFESKLKSRSSSSSGSSSSDDSAYMTSSTESTKESVDSMIIDEEL